MIIIRTGMVYVQKRDVAFLLDETTGIALPKEVEEQLKYGAGDFTDADVEFVGYTNPTVCEFLKKQPWLVNLEAIKDWKKYEVHDLIEQKKIRAKKLLAECMPEEYGEDALSGNRLRLHIRETVELRTTLYTISQLERFVEAHRRGLWPRWRDRLEWEVPD